MKQLKIFFAAHASPNSKQLSGSQIWDRNLVDSLLDLGHQLYRFDYDLIAFAQNGNPTSPKQREWQQRHRPQLEEALLKQIRACHEKEGLDLFLSYFWDAHCSAETIHTIRRMGIPTVNWFCNGSFQLHMVEKIAPAYDYCLVPEKFRLPDYRALGATPYYFQEAANPRFYQPEAVPQDVAVSFVGKCYGDRVNYISDLHAARVPIQVFGPRWRQQAQRDALWSERVKRLKPVAATRNWVRRLRGKPVVRRAAVPLEAVHDPLSDAAMVTLYSRSKIALGFSTCGDTDKSGKKILQVRLRDMEVPMCGGFYLVERFEELGDCFEYGKEIEGYQSGEELVDKCRFYLKHDQARQQIQQAGYRRALAEHTWQQRFTCFFKQTHLIP